MLRPYLLATPPMRTVDPRYGWSPNTDTAARPHCIRAGLTGLIRLLEDLRHGTGADGAAAFADGEAQAFLHGDRPISSTVILTLSPGMTISTPSGSSIVAGHVGGADVELRAVAR